MKRDLKPHTNKTCIHISQLLCVDTDVQKHVEVYQSVQGSLNLIVNTSKSSDSMM